MNPLLGRLAGTPGYESWLAEFRARRARSHAELVELEARGELAAAADVSN
jgi:hypothetical protein